DTQRQKLGAIIGENCRIGVNATLLPGIKIGKSTFIGPGEVIRDDVSDNKFFYKNKIYKNKFLKK
ncbi:MAG: DapH/DapD/GlmU-related protein, partial [Microgenomates group bacterium]